MRHLGPRSSLLLAALPLWLASVDARADLIDPAEEACGKAGDACEVDGQAGACKAETCSRLDYSNMEADDTPGTREYECVRCIVGAKPEATPEATPAPTPSAEDDAKDVPKGGPDETKTSPEPATTAKGTRCAVEPTPTSLMSLLLGLGLLGLVARRRR